MIWQAVRHGMYSDEDRRGSDFDGTLSVIRQVQSNVQQVAASKKARLFPLFVWIGCILALLIATILFANGHKNLRRLAGEPTTSLVIFRPNGDTAVSDMSVAHRPREKATVSSVLARPANEPGTLETLSNIQQRCEKLAKEEYEQPRYLHTDGYSQCTLLLVDGSNKNSPSVFVQIQTDPSGSVTSFRLKFNTLGTDAASLAKQGLIALKEFGGLGAPDDRLFRSLELKIARRQSFQLLWGHYSLEMDRELSDPNRFNLIGRPARSNQSNLEAQRLKSSLQ